LAPSNALATSQRLATASPVPSGTLLLLLLLLLLMTSLPLFFPAHLNFRPIASAGAGALLLLLLLLLPRRRGRDTRSRC